MSASKRRPILPLRRWLVLALATTFFVPVLITGIVVYHVLGGPLEPVSTATEQIGRGTTRWHDPDWQAATRSDLAAMGIDFVLVEDDREVYRSTPDPFAGGDELVRERWVERVVYPGTPRRVAYIYSDTGVGWNGQDGPPEARFLAVPIVGLISLLLTLAGIGWFLGRTVVQPLAATSQAARQVAAGDLDVRLPTSRVREVAEVNAAFESMSAELRASLRQQAEFEHERRLFIGAVVHDLRTPLFALRGYLEGLEKGLDDTQEKRARYIAVAQEKAATLERLIGDLFDFTRLEYLDQTPNPEPLDLGALLDRLVEGFRPQADTKGVQLTLALPSEPCWVTGDSHLLTRALTNLLDNALRYTPSGGQVRVTCRTEPSGVIFTVADTGPGIPAHDLPNLFAPLYRGETSRNRRTGGAGLGLTIARRILLAHGGDLSAANSQAGGAVFTGRLP
ncbi:HAMP domain-containing sensor histidine kinase, partial [Sphaerobacter sp.]|uniref:sensor histidine kinase n=1 Tax=Sphaerobacter sp. TaxID=2099654 RepID=UPI001D9BC048